jgi:predicted dehydrogenase
MLFQPPEEITKKQEAYDNIDALLEDKEIDAVYIASPVIYHKEQAFSDSILNNGKIEVTIEDALQVQRIVEAAYESSSKDRFITV